MADQKTYSVHLSDGRRLKMSGTRPPTSGEIEAAAVKAGVDHLLVTKTAPTTPMASSEAVPPSSDPAPGGGLLGIAAGLAAKSGPSILRGVNTAAQMAPRMVPKIAPALTTVAVADDLRKGNVRQAAYDAVGGSVASRYAPKAISKIVDPFVRELARRTAAQGALGRIAGGLSRVAGPVGIAADAITTPGHRPAGETAETTAARQLQFAKQYQSLVNERLGKTVITGDTTEEILASIREYDKAAK